MGYAGHGKRHDRAWRYELRGGLALERAGIGDGGRGLVLVVDELVGAAGPADTDDLAGADVTGIELLVDVLDDRRGRKGVYLQSRRTGVVVGDLEVDRQAHDVLSEGRCEGDLNGVGCGARISGVVDRAGTILVQTVVTMVLQAVEECRGDASPGYPGCGVAVDEDGLVGKRAGGQKQQ